MSANTKSLLVVVGATGTQGSAVVSYFLAHEPTYRIRGLTRNTDSPKAAALKAQGVEVVQADLHDLTSLQAAFEGAHAIFAYTDFAGAAFSAEAKSLLESGQASSLPDAAAQAELAQGRNIASAAAGTATLNRLVWSTEVDATTHGGHEVHEMSAKAAILAHMRSLSALESKLSAVSFGVFVDSILRFPVQFGWSKRADDEYVFRVPFSPSAQMAWIDMPKDAGKWVRALLSAPAGTHVEAVGGYMSLEDVAGVIGEKYGLKIALETSSLEEYTKDDPSGLTEDIAMLLRWVANHGIRGNSKEVLARDEFERLGHLVKVSDVKEGFRQLDWSPLL